LKIPPAKAAQWVTNEHAHADIPLVARLTKRPIDKSVTSGYSTARAAGSQAFFAVEAVFLRVVTEGDFFVMDKPFVVAI
jgi:hypothetical protein